jgi:hypothetical protein
MTTHLYCVLPRPLRGGAPTGVKGIGGAEVRAIPVDGLTAWVSDIGRRMPATIDGIRAHNDVVEAAMETGSTPLPARYGQRFDDDEACRAALIGRASSIEPLIAAMQGFIEMTVLITPSTNRMIRDLEPVIPEMFDSTTLGAGRRYLDTLRKREARTGEISEATDGIALELADAAAAFVERTLSHQTMTPMPLRTISHLVAREKVDAYRAAAAAVHGGSEYRILLIGPRAPYSFCALGSEPGGTHGMNLAG